MQEPSKGLPTHPIPCQQGEPQQESSSPTNRKHSCLWQFWSKKLWNSRKKDSPTPSCGLILACLILGWYQENFTHAIVADFSIQLRTGTVIWEPPLPSRYPHFQNRAPRRNKRKQLGEAQKMIPICPNIFFPLKQENKIKVWKFQAKEKEWWHW